MNLRSLFGLLALVAACSGRTFMEDDPDDVTPSGGSGNAPGPGGSGGRASPGGGYGGTNGSAPQGGSTAPPQPSAGSTSMAGSISIGSPEGGAGGSDNVELHEGGAGGDTTPPDPLGCATPIHDTWQASLGDAGSAWTKIWGDPIVDTSAGRLILSYDDIVQRKAPLQGGYYVSFEVALEGDTPFTPYVSNASVILPSLRRSGDDLELGGNMYGTGSVWSTSEPAGFGGAKIAGTTQAVVTMFVMAEAAALAVKVEAGGETYRSGWVTDFDADLSGLMLVGQNNSLGSGGSGDWIEVGPLNGCVDLDDAAVEARYLQ